MKNQIKYVRDGNTIRFIAPMNTEIDLNLLNLLASGIYPNFLACSYHLEGSRHIIAYDIKGSYSLKNYIDNQFNNLAFFLSEHFSILNECKKLSIPYCNIFMEIDTIFVRNGHLRLIVLPLVNKEQFNAKKLFKRIVRLFALPYEMRQRLLNIVRNAWSEDDALIQINNELKIYSSKSVPILPSNNFRNLQKKAEDFVTVPFLEHDGEADDVDFDHEDEEKTSFFYNDNEKIFYENETNF